MIALLEQVPAAVAVIITVYLFLKQQKAATEHWSDVVNRINDQGRKCHDECTRAVRDNTKAMNALSGVIQRCRDQAGE